MLNFSPPPVRPDSSQVRPSQPGQSQLRQSQMRQSKAPWDHSVTLSSLFVAPVYGAHRELFSALKGLGDGGWGWSLKGTGDRLTKFLAGMSKDPASFLRADSGKLYVFTRHMDFISKTLNDFDKEDLDALDVKFRLLLSCVDVSLEMPFSPQITRNATPSIYNVLKEVMYILYSAGDFSVDAVPNIANARSMYHRDAIYIVATVLWLWYITCQVQINAKVQGKVRNPMERTLCTFEQIANIMDERWYTNRLISGIMQKNTQYGVGFTYKIWEFQNFYAVRYNGTLSKQKRDIVVDGLMQIGEISETLEVVEAATQALENDEVREEAAATAVNAVRAEQGREQSEAAERLVEEYYIDTTSGSVPQVVMEIAQSSVARAVSNTYSSIPNTPRSVPQTPRPHPGSVEVGEIPDVPSIIRTPGRQSITFLDNQLPTNGDNVPSSPSIRRPATWNEAFDNVHDAAVNQVSPDQRRLDDTEFGDPYDDDEFHDAVDEPAVRVPVGIAPYVNRGEPNFVLVGDVVPVAPDVDPLGRPLGPRQRPVPKSLQRPDAVIEEDQSPIVVSSRAPSSQPNFIIVDDQPSQAVVVSSQSPPPVPNAHVSAISLENPVKQLGQLIVSEALNTDAGRASSNFNGPYYGRDVSPEVIMFFEHVPFAKDLALNGYHLYQLMQLGMSLGYVSSNKYDMWNSIEVVGNKLESCGGDPALCLGSNPSHNLVYLLADVFVYAGYNGSIDELHQSIRFACCVNDYGFIHLGNAGLIAASFLIKTQSLPKTVAELSMDATYANVNNSSMLPDYGNMGNVAPYVQRQVNITYFPVTNGKAGNTTPYDGLEITSSYACVSWNVTQPSLNRLMGQLLARNSGYLEQPSTAVAIYPSRVTVDMSECGCFTDPAARMAIECSIREMGVANSHMIILPMETPYGIEMRRNLVSQFGGYYTKGPSLGQAVAASFSGMAPVMYTGFVTDVDREIFGKSVRALAKTGNNHPTFGEVYAGMGPYANFTQAFPDDALLPVGGIPDKTLHALIVGIPFVIPHDKTWTRTIREIDKLRSIEVEKLRSYKRLHSRNDAWMVSAALLASSYMGTAMSSVDFVTAAAKQSVARDKPDNVKSVPMPAIILSTSLLESLSLSQTIAGTMITSWTSDGKYALGFADSLKYMLVSAHHQRDVALSYAQIDINRFNHRIEQLKRMLTSKKSSSKILRKMKDRKDKKSKRRHEDKSFARAAAAAGDTTVRQVFTISQNKQRKRGRSSSTARSGSVSSKRSGSVASSRKSSGTRSASSKRSGSRGRSSSRASSLASRRSSVASSRKSSVSSRRSSKSGRSVGSSRTKSPSVRRSVSRGRDSSVSSRRSSRSSRSVSSKVSRGSSQSSVAAHKKKGHKKESKKKHSSSKKASKHHTSKSKKQKMPKKQKVESGRSSVTRRTLGAKAVNALLKSPLKKSSKKKSPLKKVKIVTPKTHGKALKEHVTAAKKGSKPKGKAAKPPASKKGVDKQSKQKQAKRVRISQMGVAELERRKSNATKERDSENAVAGKRRAFVSGLTANKTVRTRKTKKADAEAGKSPDARAVTFSPDPPDVREISRTDVPSTTAATDE